MRKSGFTLAELLISLAILGIIATFTIPKILSSTDTSAKKSVFRETIATMSQLVYDGWRSGELESANQAGAVSDYFMPRLNAVKLCDTNAVAQNCWTNGNWSDGGLSGERTEAGVVLHNGAFLGGLKSNGSLSDGRDGFIIDWNGSDGPNLIGDDQLVMVMVWEEGGFEGVKAGTVSSSPNIWGWSNPAQSRTLYQWVFSN